MKKSKGLGVSSIMILLVVLLVASTIISISTAGSLGEALKQSFGDIGEVNPTVEVDNRETLSDLTMLARDRSVNQGCEIIEEINDPDEEAQSQGDTRSWGEDVYGYPGLEGTKANLTPDCFGGETGALREAGQLSPLSDYTRGAHDENYMPGVYSREQFEITEEFVLDTNTDDYWLEDQLSNAVVGSPEAVQQEIEEAEEEEDSGGRLRSAYDSVKSAAGGVRDWVKRDSIIYYGIAGEPSTDVAEPILFFQDPTFNLEDRTNLGDIDVEELDPDDIEFIVQLCPGDKGYVQGNREEIDNDRGTSSEEPVYPVVVITETEEESCGIGVSSERDYTGPYTGQQIYIQAYYRDYTGRSTPEWPKSSENDFYLRGGDEPSEGASTWQASLDLESDRCQIYYRERRPDGSGRDGVTVRSYETGTVVDRRQSTFRHDGGEGLERIESDHRSRTGRSDLDAHDLIEAMSRGSGGTGLDNSQIADTDHLGELRVESTANIGFNRLYGDLLCENPENKQAAEWHLCYEGINSNLEEINGWRCNTDLGSWNN